MNLGNFANMLASKGRFVNYMPNATVITDSGKCNLPKCNLQTILDNLLSWKSKTTFKKMHTFINQSNVFSTGIPKQSAAFPHLPLSFFPSSSLNSSSQVFLSLFQKPKSLLFLSRNISPSTATGLQARSSTC